LGEAVISGHEILGVHPGDHCVLFYPDDAELVRQVSAYLLQAMGDGGSAVVVATPAHRRLFEEQLALAGVDVVAARAEGSYVALDASETMRRFMVGGWPDTASFWQVITAVIKPAIETGQPVHVFGEMVSLLWDAGLVNAAIEVEVLWNELGGRYPFSLFCAYPAHSVTGSQHQDALTEICRVHAAAAGVPPEPDQPQLRNP
jgi:hypothetical protein